MKSRSCFLPMILSVCFVLLSTQLQVARSFATTPGEPKLNFSHQAAAMLPQLSVEEKVAQLFITTPDVFATAARGINPTGGYILFSRHVSTITDTVRLIDKLRAASKIPPFIAVDQEGGRVARLDFVTKLPAVRTLEALSANTLQEIGRLMGQELYSLGFNLNFAPVLDVATRAENPVIGNRAFSHDPYVVARLGPALIRGLQSTGIAATGKHFPGHGDTRSDSHFTLPIVEHSVERIDAVELMPFRAAVQANVAMLMIGHLHFPALDPRPDRPATLSRPVVTGLLREQLGFDGIIITDAMNMQAITDRFDAGSAAVLALQAGVDIILMPQDYVAAYQAVLSAVNSGEISLSRLNESVYRILKLKLRLAAYKPYPAAATENLNPRELVGSSTHRDWMSVLLQNRRNQTANAKIDN